MIKFFEQDNSKKLHSLLIVSLAIFVLSVIYICIFILASQTNDALANTFLTFIRGLGFIISFDNGTSAVISLITTLLFYSSIVYLVLGILYLKKNDSLDKKEGLFIELISIINFLILLSFIYEVINNHLSAIWVIFSIIIEILLIGNIVLSICYTFKKEASNPTPVLFFEKKEEVPIVKEDIITPKNEPIKEKNDSNPYNSLGKRRKRLSFENMVKKSKKETIERYKEIVNGLNEYNYNDRKSIPGETFSYKKERLIFLTFSGSTLKVYFKLNPNEYQDSTIPIKDVSNIIRYKDLPSCLVIKSDLAARRAVILGQTIAKQRKIPKR